MECGGEGKIDLEEHYRRQCSGPQHGARGGEPDEQTVEQKSGYTGDGYGHSPGQIGLGCADEIVLGGK